MENPFAYRLVQIPFTSRKLAPILDHNNTHEIRRVLDVGCGPGTNTAIFAGVDYLGMDINPDYIEQARRRFHRNFVVADVTQYRVSRDERYDFILVNSLLHHLPEDAVQNLLQHLSTLLAPDGYIHILELVLPEHPFFARKMAQWDRGEYTRPLAQWQSIFQSAFQNVLFEPYPVHVAGVEALSMVYFKGCPKQSLM